MDQRNVGYAVLSILASQKGTPDQRECRIVRHEKGQALSLRVNSTPFEVGGKVYTVFSVADISQEKNRKVLQRVLYQSILGHARDVRRGAEALDEASLEGLMQFKRQASHFSDLLIEEVNEHRIVSAAEEGELRVQPTQLVTLDVLEKLVTYFETQPEAKGKILRTVQVRHAEFVSDRVLLMRILSNLIRNALEACDEGQTVTLSAGLQGDTITFKVHNPGTISRETQLQIFQRGFTTKGEGRGVGAYAARLLCEKYLNGEISFNTSEGRGIMFSVSLPRFDSTQATDLNV